MSTKALLIVTALIEVGTGMALVVRPSLTVELLLGVGLSSPQALVVGRVAGAALVSIGVACWLSKNGERRGAQLGLVVGLLIYNVAVPLLLIQAAIAEAMHGVALWPASVLHMALALWCCACLATEPRKD